MTPSSIFWEVDPVRGNQLTSPSAPPIPTASTGYVGVAAAGGQHRGNPNVNLREGAPLARRRPTWKALSLTLVRRIVARPGVVYEALSTADGVAAWWVADDLAVTSLQMDLRVGGGYQMTFRTLNGIERKASGEFLEVTPPSRLVMTWGLTDGGELEEVDGMSRLDFEVRAIDGGSELTFSHIVDKADAPHVKQRSSVQTTDLPLRALRCQLK
jgi:uncharacterized protein YndB with AHSA1/START domain